MWVNAEAWERFRARAYAPGVEEKARELCIEGGENPDTELIDLGPNWFRWVGQARTTLGLDDLEGASREV
jgi:hypothetical protein